LLGEGLSGWARLCFFKKPGLTTAIEIAFPEMDGGDFEIFEELFFFRGLNSDRL
jgi:hypothetical protein